MDRKIPGPISQGASSSSSSSSARLSLSSSSTYTTSSASETSQASCNTEANIEIFFSPAWRNMCKNLDLPMESIDRLYLTKADPELIISSITSVVRKASPCMIADILQGDFDLRVPRLIAIIHQVITTSEGSKMVRLLDSTGTITGYYSGNVLKMHSAACCQGTCMLLKNIVIFVNKSDPIDRYLNIHDQCIVAMCPAS